ncbi:histidinol-phosphate transaminase [Dokdonella sp. MW10]|uniref:histidinol-phosphate transaminase n=1 Tax=Dokdonella sp. MW10 TaxID=2992926 RepID=UPI003F803685
MSILDLARPEVLALTPYSSARNEAGTADVMLNANESPWGPTGAQPELRGRPLNRYPDPQPRILVERLADLYGVDPGQVLVGRGSDEAIDLLMRAFCRPGRDAVVVSPPTFGMYAVSAAVQGARVVEAPLGDGFAFDVDALVADLPVDTKLVFLCSPNNPTGGTTPLADIARLAGALRGRALLIVDEAYIEFADLPSAATLLRANENLGVLRTLSKAWALAGARVGCLLAMPEIVSLLRRIMAPYPLPTSSVSAALAALTAEGHAQTHQRVALITSERERLANALSRLPGVIEVLPSRANFLCVQFEDAPAVYRALLRAGIVVRDVGRYPRLEGHLRITVGSREENARLLEQLIRQQAAA